MPTRIRSRHQAVRGRRALGAALLLVCSGVLAACGNAQPSSDVAPDGLVALVGTADKTSLKRWDATGGDPIAITAPKGGATWISTGRSDVLAATLADGTTATSDPIRAGTTLAWRIVKAVDPTGSAPKGPDYFATWDPDGGRYAVLAGDLLSGDAIRVVLVDPSVGSAFVIPIDGSVVAAPPAWIDGDRLVVVTGDAAAPVATIVDTTTGETSGGPAGARLLATSGNGRRVATMDGQGAGRDPRHGRVAGRRRVVCRFRRAAQRLDHGDRLRARRDRAASRRRVAGAGRIRHAGRPRRPVGLASRREAGDRRCQRGRGGLAALGVQAETRSEAAKIETCASSGSITPKTFWRVRRWTHDPQLSK